MKSILISEPASPGEVLIAERSDQTDGGTIWHTGDYLKAGATSYSTRIAAVRLPGCP